MFEETTEAIIKVPDGPDVCRNRQNSTCSVRYGLDVDDCQTIGHLIRPFTILKHPVPIGTEAFRLSVSTNIMSLPGLLARLSFS